MKKIKIITDTDIHLLEDEVNKFISDREVTDIQFQMVNPGNNTISTKFSAMIVYEEKE